MSKLALCLPVILLLAGHAFAGDPPAAAPLPEAKTPDQRPLATILSVVVEADKQSLTVNYEYAGKPCADRFTFPGKIEDFRYCGWQYGLGVAVVGRVGSGDKAEYYCGTCYLSGTRTPVHKPAKIKAPAGEFPVLGIGNTNGDSIIVTALRHARSGQDPKETVTGWMWIDNCPVPDGEGVAGYVTPLSVTTEFPVQK